MASPEHVYTEAEVLKQFGTDYDLPKDEGDEDLSPYRFLREWYVVKKSDPDTPVALPRDMRLKNYIIYGKLEPTSVGSLSPISILITPALSTQGLALDPTHERRGLWISPNNGQRESAWYWLRDPHAEKQASLHHALRARFGLFNNIVDALQELEPDDIDMKYLKSHCERSPKQFHDHLTCSDETEFRLKQSECTEYPLFQEPFDYELFQEQGGLAFFKQHMGSLEEAFENSNLGKAIKNMKSKRAKIWTPEQFKESAKLAEERSQRYSWGEPLPHARRVHPNWYVDARLEKAQNERLRKKKSGRKVTDDSSEDEDVDETAAKRRRHVLDDSDDDEPRSKRNKTQVDTASKVTTDSMAEYRYSDERMVEALNQLKKFLTPVPSKETGKLEDVVEKKFRVKDADSGKGVVTLMKKPTDNLSHECKLLMIIAFRNVCRLKQDEKKEKKILFKLFTKDKSDGKKNGMGIFEKWKRDALERLEGLAHEKKDEKWYKDIVAYHFLHEYIRFIKECFVVKGKKDLERLNDDFDVPWNQTNYLEDVVTFETKHAHKSNVLRADSVLTRTHLKRIREQTPAPAAVPSAAAAPDPVARAPAASAPSSSHAETPKAVQSAKRGRDEQSPALDEAEQKKRKFAEERKKKLLASLSKTNSAAPSPQVVRSASRPAARPASQPFSQGSARPPAVPSSYPSRTSDPRVPTRPLPAASNSSSSRTDSLPANRSIWKNRPRTILASEERFAPVTGNEFFFMKPIPPANALPARAGAAPPREPQQDRGRERGAREAASGGYSQSHQSRRDSSTQQGYRPSENDRQGARSNDRSSQSARPPRDHGSQDRRDQHEDYRSASGGRSSSSRDDSRSRRDDGRGHDRDSRPHGYGQDRRSNDRQDRAPAFGAANEAGGGSGRGRGRHMTQPAWMKANGQQPVVPQAPVQDLASVGRGQPVQRVQPAHQVQPVQPVVHQAPVEDLSSRGRGRGRTLPAWMAQQQGGGNGPLPQAGGNVPLPQARPAPVQQNGGLNCHNPTGVRAGGAGGAAAAGGGAGRGRGRGQTLPAWMTRQQG